MQEHLILENLHLQEITLVGTYCYTNKDFQETINLINKKRP